MPLSLGRENVFGEGCCCLAAGILFSGPGTRKNDLSDLAEREGFYYRRYLQATMNPTLPR
jgi:hypothetical protein